MKFPWKERKIKNIINAQILKTISFAAEIIVISGAINKNSIKVLTPAHNNIGNSGAKIITAVPKSGWFKTKNEENIVIIIGTITI